MKDQLKINFLGDSITCGCGTTGADKCFVSLIARQTGALCRNYGVSGTRIAAQKKPSEIPAFDQDFCSRIAEMAPDADLVVVFGGTNDFGLGDAPLGCMSDRTPYTFYGALHVLIAGLIEKYPHAQLVMLTPLHRWNEDNPCGGNTHGVTKPSPVGTLRDYVQIIREVAEYYSLPVLDLFACSGLQPQAPTLRQQYMPDGLHPNDAGHALLAQRLIAFLKATGYPFRKEGC